MRVLFRRVRQAVAGGLDVLSGALGRVAGAQQWRGRQQYQSGDECGVFPAHLCRVLLFASSAARRAMLRCKSRRSDVGVSLVRYVYNVMLYWIIYGRPDDIGLNSLPIDAAAVMAGLVPIRRFAVLIAAGRV